MSYDIKVHAAVLFNFLNLLPKKAMKCLAEPSLCIWVFRIIPVFRILRLTVHRKSAVIKTFHRKSATKS